MKQVLEKLNITAFTLKLQTLRQEAVTCFVFLWRSLLLIVT